MSVPPPSQAGIVTILAPLFAPGLLWSWDRTGHRVSAMMAELRLTPAALAAVCSLLKPGEALADASTWADEQREVLGIGPWHYVNVPILEPRYDPRFCSPEGCVVSEVKDCERVLVRPTILEGQEARSAQIPRSFHPGPAPAPPWRRHRKPQREPRSDALFNVGTNLHQMWDFRVMESHSTDEAMWLQELNSLATPQMAAAWSKGTVEEWATESLADVKLAYCLPGTDRLIASGTKLGEDYCQSALPIIQLRLAQSAVRSAATLNQIFR